MKISISCLSLVITFTSCKYNDIIYKYYIYTANKK